MEQRRKRRNSKDIEKAILDAATILIREGGFGNLTATGIMQKAEIEPIQFYKRYKDLNIFISEYVKIFDFWFSDIIKESSLDNNINIQYENILCNLFYSLWDNKIMQELLRWEIATKNESSFRTAKLRELHTLPLCKKFSDAFSGTEIDIVAISALIVGGIYYMILHCELSEFSGINLNNEQDRERIIKAIKYLSDILFQTPSSGYSTIKIASNMKKDDVPLEKIAEYTNLPIQIIKGL
jgi:hypothetical protein